MTPRDEAEPRTDPVPLLPPLLGRWTPRKSPADAVPSHGTHRFATARSLDLVPVGADDRTAPITTRSLLGTEPAGRFPGFGREVLAPCDGQVVRAHDEEPDHRAYRGLASLGYALTQGRRAARGWIGLAGNHLVIATNGGNHGTVFVALCHLRRGSILPVMGDRVRAGQPIAACGNSGNSMEPHLHLQVMSGLDAERATAIPFVLPGGLPRRGEILHSTGR